MWSSSSCQRLSQRRPPGPVQVQRPASRFQTWRFTSIGTVLGLLASRAAGWDDRLRAGATTPLRFPCFSMAQRTASRKTAVRSPRRTLWLRRVASVSRSFFRSRYRVVLQPAGPDLRPDPGRGRLERQLQAERRARSRRVVRGDLHLFQTASHGASFHPESMQPR